MTPLLLLTREELQPVILNAEAPSFEKKPFWKINKVYCGGRSDGSIPFALEQIAKIEGFSLATPPVHCDWLRDSAYPLTEHKWLVPCLVSEREMEMMRLKATTICPADTTDKKWDLNFLGVELSRSEYGQYDLYSTFQAKPEIEFSTVYFQGGNILKAEQKDGSKCHLVGAYNVIASSIQLGQTEEAVTKAFRQVFPEQVHFLGLEKKEQLAYHLDISLLPLMGGRVLVQDHDLSAKLLEIELKNTQLTDAERKEFSLYLQDAKELANIERKRLIRTKEELEQAGFTPISVAANYYIDGYPKINYINSLHGFGDKNRSFVVTTFFNTPGEARLQTIFNNYLKEQGVECIYYLPLANAGEMLDDGGSIHCNTIEV